MFSNNNIIKIINNSKFKNVRMRKNVRIYHSHQVAWQRSANKDANFFRTSDIFTYSYILKRGVNPLIMLLKFELIFPTESAPLQKGYNITIDKVTFQLYTRWVYLRKDSHSIVYK